MTGRRDPEGRRRRITEAACQVIAESGVDAVTHRLVAARAGVPLGATTYYFASLDDLTAAALRYAADLSAQELRAWETALHDSADVPAALAELTAAYLADRPRALTEMQLYLAAAYRPELRPAARVWTDGLTDILTAYASPRAARAAVTYLDGALLHGLTRDEPLSAASLSATLAALLG
ncbi:TetR/AcrR family transcriptional regulator [Streptomyces sp. NPDC093221]|uniref:TetR/AcrR family transcriptional regulator n=1 Tax=Streptomyces sp. NPDC093221 TaxID=3366032 RepID=UPI0037FB2F4A